MILYAINLICVSIAFQAQIVYAYRNDLVRPRRASSSIEWPGRRTCSSPQCSSSRSRSPFVNTTVAVVLWIAVFAVGKRLEDRLASLRGGRRAGS